MYFGRYSTDSRSWAWNHTHLFARLVVYSLCSLVSRNTSWLRMVGRPWNGNRLPICLYTYLFANVFWTSNALIDGSGDHITSAVYANRGCEQLLHTFCRTSLHDMTIWIFNGFIKNHWSYLRHRLYRDMSSRAAAPPHVCCCMQYISSWCIDLVLEYSRFVVPWFTVQQSVLVTWGKRNTFIIWMIQKLWQSIFNNDKVLPLLIAGSSLVPNLKQCLP